MSTVPVEAPSTETEPEIDYEALVTEDHKPVDRIFVEKLYRLLTHPLYASWPGPGEGRPFLVLVNVGWFYQRKTPAVVPDCLLSLGVTCPTDLQTKQGHSYYQWDMGKPPEVVIEIVSDRSGGEESFKKKLYAQLGVAHYAVFDPDHILSSDSLRTYELVGGEYRLANSGPWPQIGLGLRLWQGQFEGHEETWLRWCDVQGDIIPTAEERAAQADEHARLAAEQAAQADDRARLAAEQAAQADDRARLAAERIAALEAELQHLKNKPSPEAP
jgi:Uma2 family endonuclease